LEEIFKSQQLIEDNEGDPYAFETFMSRDASFYDKKFTEYKFTLLQFAVYHNKLVFVEYFFTHIQPRFSLFEMTNTADILGNTAAHLAAYHDHDELVKILRENNSNFKIKNNNSETPLFIALNYDCERVLDLLINDFDDSEICAMISDVDISEEKRNQLFEKVKSLRTMETSRGNIIIKTADSTSVVDQYQAQEPTRVEYQKVTQGALDQKESESLIVIKQDDTTVKSIIDVPEIVLIKDDVSDESITSEKNLINSSGGLPWKTKRRKTNIHCGLEMRSDVTDDEEPVNRLPAEFSIHSNIY